MARLPVELVLVGAYYQLHLLVTQVIFVNAGTSHGFTARRAADLEEGQSCMVLSQRHRVVTAMPHIPELWLLVVLGWDGPLWQLRGSVWPSRKLLPLRVGFEPMREDPI